MKKTVFMIFLILMLFALVSCGDQISGFYESPDTLVSVTFRPVINHRKSIISSIQTKGLEVDTFQYRASPVSKNSLMKGGSDSWTDLVKKGNKDNEYETSQSFSVGQWLFEIRALNENGGLIYQGSSTAVLITDQTKNIVDIDLVETVNSETEDKGSVVIDISTPHLIDEGEAGTLTVAFSTVAGVAVNPSVKTALDSSESNGVITFTGEYELEPGFYLVKASYSETSGEKTASMSSSVVALRVIENTSTTISGNIEESLFVSATLNLNNAKTLSGSLGQTNKDGVYTFVFTASSGDNYLSPTSYYWYVDGTAVQSANTNTYAYTPGTAYGIHSVTCVAVYEATGTYSVFSDTEQITVNQPANQ